MIDGDLVMKHAITNDVNNKIALKVIRNLGFSCTISKFSFILSLKPFLSLVKIEKSSKDVE